VAGPPSSLPVSTVTQPVPHFFWPIRALISASKTYFPQIASLLTRFKENEMLTRHQMRLELGFKEKPAAQTFALVLLADDYLCLSTPKATTSTTTTTTTPTTTTTAAAAAREGSSVLAGDDSDCAKRRFFIIIACRLPMELQMALCRRVVGLTGDLVLTRHLEPALRNWVKAFLPPTS